MPKYEVIIDSMDSSTSIKSAKGRIRLAAGDKELTQFDLVQFPYNGKMIWKIFENGVIAPSPAVSMFQRGHRQTLAAWALKVEADPTLVGQSNLTANVSQAPAGNSNSGASSNLALEKANERIKSLEDQIAFLVLRLGSLEAHLDISYDDEEESYEDQEDEDGALDDGNQEEESYEDDDDLLS